MARPAVAAAALTWFLGSALLAAQSVGTTGLGLSDSEHASLLHALLRLPLAAGLGAMLAMRPRRAGTPPRKPAVVQTQGISR